MDEDEHQDEEWLTPFQRRKPQLELVMLDDGSREIEPDQVVQFLERIAEGDGPTVTGLALGWSPHRIKQFLANPDYKEIIEALQEARHETAERAIYHHMLGGNSTAMRLYAFCQMGHRGWVDRKHINHSGSVQQEVVMSVSKAITDRLGQIRHGGQDAVAELQNAYLTPDIPTEDDDDVVDGEVIDGTG